MNVRKQGGALGCVGVVVECGVIDTRTFKLPHDQHRTCALIGRDVGSLVPKCYVTDTVSGVHVSAERRGVRTEYCTLLVNSLAHRTCCYIPTVINVQLQFVSGSVVHLHGISGFVSVHVPGTRVRDSHDTRRTEVHEHGHALQVCKSDGSNLTHTPHANQRVPHPWSSGRPVCIDVPPGCSA